MKRKTQLLTVFILLLFVKVAFTQVTFQKTLGASVNTAWQVQQTIDTGYIICGTGFLLIKTNANGDTLWSKSFDGAGNGLAECVQQTNDGGYIVSGYTYSFGAGNSDGYLVKTDSIGNLLWSKTYGGIYNDDITTVQSTFDGGYILLGSTPSFGTGPSDFDVYLIKTDANGDTLWTKIFGGTGSDNGLSMQQTIDSGYVITGYTNSFGVGQDDVYLLKTDNNGNLLWSKTFGGTESDAAWSVKQTTDGGYIVGGTTHSSGANNYGDIYLVKTNSNGDTLWTKAFGGAAGTEQGYCVQQTNDGGIIVFGETYSFGGHSDLYLIKTDSSGNPLWSKTFGGTEFDHGYSVQQTDDGGYVMVGTTNSFGSGGFYFIKTDNNGNSNCNESNPPTIVMTTNTQVTVPATLVSSGSIVSTPPATQVNGVLTINTLCTSVGINEIFVSNSFLVSPNPSPGNFIIAFGRTIVKGNIEILTILGENVFAENIFNESKKEINLKNISQGIYFAKVHDGEKYYCKKIIIEKD